MKNSQKIIVFGIFSLGLLWSCNEDVVTPNKSVDYSSAQIQPYAGPSMQFNPAINTKPTVSEPGGQIFYFGPEKMDPIYLDDNRDLRYMRLSLVIDNGEIIGLLIAMKEVEFPEKGGLASPVWESDVLKPKEMFQDASLTIIQIDNADVKLRYRYYGHIAGKNSRAWHQDGEPDRQTFDRIGKAYGEVDHENNMAIAIGEVIIQR